MKNLYGKFVHLRPIEEGDLQILHKWRNSREFLDLCSVRKYEVSFEEFCAELQHDFEQDRHEQYLILVKNRPVGTIFSYSVNEMNRNGFITTFIDRRWNGRGFGVFALRLLGERVFSELNFHKIYVDVYSHNKHSLECLRHIGFIEEGRFRDHLFWQDTWHDLVRLAFFRSQYQKLAESKDIDMRRTKIDNNSRLSSERR